MSARTRAQDAKAVIAIVRVRINDRLSEVLGVKIPRHQH
jgi:hypothetical protein